MRGFLTYRELLSRGGVFSPYDCCIIDTAILANAAQNREYDSIFIVLGNYPWSYRSLVAQYSFERGLRWHIRVACVVAMSAFIRSGFRAIYVADYLACIVTAVGAYD